MHCIAETAEREDVRCEFRSTVPEIYVFGHTFGILLRPEMGELPGVAT